MNIGYDASRAFNKNKTGTENYSYQILIHLSKIDHTNNYYIYLRPGAIITESWPSNFKFITIPYPRLWTQVGLALQTIYDPLDILFIPAHTIPLLKKPAVKTVVTVHDLGAEYLPKTHQLKQRLYLNFMTHYQLKSATHLIAVSKSTRDDLIKKVGVSANKISVVYEGYNQDLFKQVNNDLLNNVLKEYELVKKQYFLFIGTIQPRKNLEKLIRAYAQFLAKTGDGKRDASSSTHSEARTSDGAASRQDPFDMPPLVLAGNKGWLSEDIYELPKKMGIKNQVKFLGYVPDDKLPALYCGAKAFLYPSLFEGFGLPILEAFSCGCPVLTSSTSSIPEVTGEAAVLIDPSSVDDIAQGIEKITNKELTTKLIKAGLEQVKKFSWEKAAYETLQILTKTTSG